MFPFLSQLILTLTFLAGAASLPQSTVGEAHQAVYSSQLRSSSLLVHQSLDRRRIIAEGFEPEDRGKPDGTQGSGTRCVEEMEPILS